MASKKKESSSGLAFIIACILVYGVVHYGLIGGSLNTQGVSKNCAAMERLWVGAGGSPSAAFTAAEVAMAESSGYRYATHYNTNGTVDRGYWQINSIHHGSSFGAMKNARAAVRISGNGSDWTPWVTYNSGAYQGQC